MSSFVLLNLEGGGILERKLRNIEAKVAKKVVRRAVRVAQKITLAAAKSNTGMIGGFTGGEIKQNLKIVAPKQRRGQFRLQVGISSKANEQFVVISKAGNRNYIPAAIEYGHGSNKEGSAIPFMRKANDSTERAKVAIVSKELQTGILQAAR